MSHISIYSTPKSVRVSRIPRSAGTLATAVSMAVLALPIYAHAGNGNIHMQNVAHGTAAVLQSASLTQITATNGAIINFDSFDIPKNTSVNFVLPSKSARVYDHVISGGVSSIDGSLTSNGIVYLINPAGINLGSTANINAAGMYVVAGNLSNEDFIAGRNRFTGLTGAVENQGAVQTTSDTVLAGRTVINTGSIVSEQGAVAMVSGQNVLIAEKNSQLLAQISPDAGATGMFGSGDVYSLALKNGGRIQAPQVNLQADTTSSVAVSGTIQSTAGTHGGTVNITAGSVTLAGAAINASGATGGGSVNIGGDHHGTGSLANAAVTTISQDSTIHADALSTGNGGNVTVWSDKLTDFQGSLSASGNGIGNGGSAEVSSRLNLNFQGLASLASKSGKRGTLLLDPQSLQINSTGTDIIPASGAVLATDPGDNGTGASSISPSEILNIASTGTKVSLAASSTISVESPLTFSGTGPASNFVLDAPSITFHAVISGNVMLTLQNSTDSTGLIIFGNIGTLHSPVNSVTFNPNLNTTTGGKVLFEGPGDQSVYALQNITFSDLPAFSGTGTGDPTFTGIYAGVGDLTLFCTAVSTDVNPDPGSIINLGVNRNLEGAFNINLYASHVTTVGIDATESVLISGPRGGRATSVAFELPTGANNWSNGPGTAQATVIAESGTVSIYTKTFLAPQSPVIVSVNPANEADQANLISDTVFYSSIPGGPLAEISFATLIEVGAGSKTLLAAVPPSSPASVIAANVGPVESPIAQTPQTLGESAIRTLQLLQVNVRQSEPAETGAAFQIIDDWPRKIDPTAADRQVSPSRVSIQTAQDAADLYTQLFGEHNEKLDSLKKSIRALARDRQDLKPEKFAFEINRLPNSDPNKSVLLQLKDLREKVANLGLSAAEMDSSYRAWMPQLVVDQGYDTDWLKEVLNLIHA